MDGKAAGSKKKKPRRGGKGGGFKGGRSKLPKGKFGRVDFTITHENKDNGEYKVRVQWKEGHGTNRKRIGYSQLSTCGDRLAADKAAAEFAREVSPTRWNKARQGAYDSTLSISDQWEEAITKPDDLYKVNHMLWAQHEVEGH